jgi:hypothetical protein
MATTAPPPRETQPVFKNDKDNDGNKFIDYIAQNNPKANKTAVSSVEKNAAATAKKAVSSVEKNTAATVGNVVDDVVGDVAGDIDPIGPLIQKINPENIKALSKGIAKIVIDTGTATSAIVNATGNATSVIMDATGRLINNAGAVVGSLVKNSTEVINTAGNVIATISAESLKTLKAIGITGMGVVGKVVNEFIKAGSETAKEVIKEYGKIAEDAINAASDVAKTGITTFGDVWKNSSNNRTNLSEFKVRAALNKSLVGYIVIGVIVLAVIIAIVVGATVRPKKMTNNMSIPMNFDHNYDPEAQSCFTEREYKYYNI